MLGGGGGLKQMSASRTSLDTILLSVDHIESVASMALGVRRSLSFRSWGQISEALGAVLVNQSEDKTVEHRVTKRRRGEG